MSGVLPAYGGGGAVRPFPLLRIKNRGHFAAAPGSLLLLSTIIMTVQGRHFRRHYE